MHARIFQPARTAMQSGFAKTKIWHLVYETGNSRSLDPLMGWTSSSDTRTQVMLQFDTRDAAVAYAQANGLDYVVTEPHKREHTIRPRGYGENFASDRRANWTH